MLMSRGSFPRLMVLEMMITDEIELATTTWDDMMEMLLITIVVMGAGGALQSMNMVGGRRVPT